MTDDERKRQDAAERIENALRYARRATDAPRLSQYRDCRGFGRYVKEGGKR